jgi:hypothetical protein
MTSNNCSVGPQIDERIDVAVERIRFRCDFENVMHHHVGLQRAHEKKRRRARIAAADHAGIHGTPEIVADDHQSASRGAVGGIGIKRYDY